MDYGIAIDVVELRSQALLQLFLRGDADVPKGSG
jgi:hypothetical protein